MSLSIVILGKFPPTCGQVSTLTYWLAKGLVEKGAKVTVVTDAYFPTKQCIRSNFDHSSEETLGHIDNIDVVYAKHLSESVFLPFSELAYISFLSQARKVVENVKPDVIFSHYLEPYALAGCHIADEFNTPHVVTHAGSDIVRLCKSPETRSLYQSILSKNSYFVAKSNIAREIFSDHPARAVASYLPNPQYFKPTNKAEKQDGPVFGFYGKFVHGKKLTDIIDAFALYYKKYNRGRLLLVGGDIGGKFKLDDYLDKAACEAIEVRKFIPTWEVPQLLNSLDCLLYTKGGYKIAQHAAIIVREAVACQTPVLATMESLAGMPKSLINYGQVNIIEASTSPYELCDIMQKQIEQPRKINENAYTYFKEGYNAYVDFWLGCLKEAAE